KAKNDVNVSSAAPRTGLASRDPKISHQEGKDLRRSLLTAAAAVLVAGLALTGVAGAQHASPKATITAALVSDIGKFNDRSFNQSQLEGLNAARKALGVKVIPLQSNSVSDYLPNMTQAVREHADIVIAAGFLLADTLETVANKFPDTK